MKYPKVINENVLTKLELTEAKGEFYIEEKYDGSQFRFGVKDGVKWYGSKSVDYKENEATQKMFRLAVEQAEKALNKIPLVDNIAFFAEFLSSPKHNTLTYERVPTNNLVIFDVYDLDENKYLTPDLVNYYAKKLGLEGVKVFATMDKFPSKQMVDEYLKQESALGGSKIEGVVIKNYSMIIEINTQIRPLIYKYVRDDFKELNNKEWNKHPDKQKIDGIVADTINREAIFRKAVQHLVESGKFTGNMRDMRDLVDLVYDDLEQEYKTVIAEKLYEKFEKDVKALIVKGLPEYYKDYLFEQTEKAINQ